MPEKSLTVATYAAGASLAAITLIYVFAPTYLLDGGDNAKGRSSSSRKRGVVGLANPANDCFINSILQALAGLGDLRIYLIRETHRRSLDDAWVYAQPVPADGDVAHAWDGDGRRRPHQQGPAGKPMPEWKVLGLQSGIVTHGLKRILDQLNERPIYKKTASALPFVRDLETAFRQRISRQQQDAQEFLQVVAERLCDEYHAGRRARRHARLRSAGAVDASLVGEKLAKAAITATEGEAGEGLDLVEHARAGAMAAPAPVARVSVGSASGAAATTADGAGGDGGASQERGGDDGDGTEAVDEDEDGFPMEGKFESQIECLTCGFKPRPTEATFCTLTLHVPQVSSTTLNSCFDGMFKTENIDDFKCERCRLAHARDTLAEDLARMSSSSSKKAAASETRADALRVALGGLEQALATDPEHYQPPPESSGIELPDARHAPKRRIARHIRMTHFPKVLAIHLSRSIYDRGSQSQKNSAKVAFPERLALGGLLNRRNYKLLGVVTHKGSHHSGHYESFRRQNVYPPYSTPNVFQASSVYSKSTAASPRAATPASATPVAATPRIKALQRSDGQGTPTATSVESSPLASTQDLSLPSLATSSLKPGAKSPSPSRSASDSTASLSSSNQRTSPLVPPGPTSAPPRKEKDADSSSLRSVARSTLSKIASSPRSASRSRSRKAGGSQSPDSNGALPTSALTSKPSTPKPPAGTTAPTKHRRKKGHDLWWRLSDDKVKEASTKEVLSMQREVYLLFYELEKEDDAWN